MTHLKTLFSMFALLCLGAIGCSDAEAGDTEIVSLFELPCAELDAGVWESAPLPPANTLCAWLKFNGSSTYQISHGLGRTPRVVLGYLAFEDTGVSSTIGAGDSFLIRDGDDQTITLRNGTQQDFYLRLVLQ